MNVPTPNGIELELWKLLVSITLPLVLFILQRAYQNYDQNRERRRKLYAQAYAVCMDYKEFPYIIYRRGSSDPEVERLRISTELRHIQKDIAYHLAWTKTESDNVYEAYSALVKRTRQVAGGEMIKAWNAKPIKSDKEMNMATKIDWKDLKDYEEHFIDAAKHELDSFWKRLSSKTG